MSPVQQAPGKKTDEHGKTKKSRKTGIERDRQRMRTAQNKDRREKARKRWLAKRWARTFKNPAAKGKSFAKNQALRDIAAALPASRSVVTDSKTGKFEVIERAATIHDARRAQQATK